MTSDYTYPGVRVPLLATDPAQDKILEEFLAKNKIQSALDHLNKRIKKNKKDEHDPRLRVMRTLLEILKERRAEAQTPGESFGKIMSLLLWSLNDLAPRFSKDPECVQAVDDISRGSWGSNLWKSLSEFSQSEHVYEAWFESQFRKGQYDEAAKACFAWRKAHPQKFYSLTWTFALCHFMAWGNAALDENKRKTSKLMCVTLADQAVANTPIVNQKVIAIQSEEDLELVIKIYLKQEKSQELLTLLDDPSRGLGSPFGNWNVAQEKLELLDMLTCKGQLEARSQLEAFCRELLEDVLIARNGSTANQRWGLGNSGDNGVVYKHLTELTDDTTYEATKVLYESLVTAGSSNAEIALPELHAKIGPSDDVVFQAVKKFWSKFAPLGRAHHIGLLLQPHPDLLPKVVEFAYSFGWENSSSVLPQPGIQAPVAQQKEALASARGAIASLTQALLLHYDLTVNSKDRDADTRPDVLSIIMCSVDLWMRTLAYETSKSTADNGIGDEALILAARGCLYLSHHHNSEFPTALTWARIMLQEVVEFSKHNFRALILLVRVCLVQGAASMGMAYYQRLDIKNLQYITESAVMFRELSLLCPRKSGAYDPLAYLKRMHDWIGKRRERQVNCVIEATNNGKWVSALESKELENKLYGCPEAALINIEICRIADRRQSGVDLALHACALEDLTLAVGGQDFAGGTFDPEDALGNEFPAENRWLDLSGRIHKGKFDIALWKTLRVQEIRLIIHGNIVDMHVTDAPADGIPPQVRFLSAIVVGLGLDTSEFQGKGSIVGNCFSLLQEWVSTRKEMLAKEPDPGLVSYTGALMVSLQSLYDDLDLMMDVCSWVAEHFPMHRGPALALGSSAIELKTLVFEWVGNRKTMPDSRSIVGTLKNGVLDDYFQVLFAPSARKKVLEERISAFTKSREWTFGSLSTRYGDGSIAAYNERVKGFTMK